MHGEMLVALRIYSIRAINNKQKFVFQNVRGYYTVYVQYMENIAAIYLIFFLVFLVKDTKQKQQQ